MTSVIFEHEANYAINRAGSCAKLQHTETQANLRNDENNTKFAKTMHRRGKSQEDIILAKPSSGKQQEYMEANGEYFNIDFEEYKAQRSQGLEQRATRQESNMRLSSHHSSKDNRNITAERASSYSKDGLNITKDKSISSLLENHLKNRESVVIPRLDLGKVKGSKHSENSKDSNIKKYSSNLSNKVDKNDKKNINRFSIQTFNPQLSSQNFYNNSKLEEMKSLLKEKEFMSNFTSNESSTEALITNPNEIERDRRIISNDKIMINEDSKYSSHPHEGSILEYIK